VPSQTTEILAVMKNIILSGTAALASFGFASASCNGPVIGGISYCNSVEQITYNDLGYSGTYKDVSGWDSNSCTCSYQSKSFSGPLAPLNEGLSLHFRGPQYLKQFGVYYPSPKYKVKRQDIHQHLGRHHAHHAHHKRDYEITSTITVDQCGKTILPRYNKPSETPTPDSKGGDGAGAWERAAYYNAEQQTAKGLVFLANHGGQGSGDFNMNCGGSSISYMSPDTKSGSATPKILKNGQISTCDEFIIFSDQPCTPETCGYSRPGIPAFQGFAGDKKIFVFEFSMPHDVTGSTINDDMPAIWALNSKIPRTFQYGIGDGQKFPFQTCSCWESGCGELDLFEVLEGAKNYLKTHYHSQQGNQGGGSEEYFPRPVDKFVKAAVIFNGDKEVTIRILPDDTEFKETMGGDTIKKFTTCDSSSIYSLSY